MTLAVQFFAQLRELAGVSNLQVDLPAGARVQDLLDKLYAEIPDLRAHDKTLLIGAGVEFVNRNYQLQANDEISIMPPVQGG